MLDSPDAFGSTYGEEASHSESAWRDWAAGRWRGGTAIALAGRDPTGAVVGTATGAEFAAEPGVAHLYAMWVAGGPPVPGGGRPPPPGGGGGGRALVEAVAAWARYRGCGRVVLFVTETNQRARGFYEACGFADTGERRPLREGSDLDVLVFAKTL